MFSFVKPEGMLPVLYIALSISSKVELHKYSTVLEHLVLHPTEENLEPDCISFCLHVL